MESSNVYFTSFKATEHENLLQKLPSHIADGKQTEPDASVRNREFRAAFVDVRRQDTDTPPGAF